MLLGVQNGFALGSSHFGNPVLAGTGCSVPVARGPSVPEAVVASLFPVGSERSTSTVVLLPSLKVVSTRAEDGASLVDEDALVDVEDELIDVIVLLSSINRC
jgi:hypothetical protein